MSEIQAVLFDKSHWSTSKARKWLKKKKMKPIKRVDKTKNLLRYRLQDPRKFIRFRIKKIPKFNLDFVFGFKKQIGGALTKVPKVDWMDKPLKGWGTNTPKAEFAKQVQEFGRPSVLDPRPGGFAVWDYNKLRKLGAPADCLYRVEIKDEQVPHGKPAPHTDFLYYWMFMDIPKKLIHKVLAISDSISYDPLKTLLQVRCHFSGANWSTLYSALIIINKKYNIKEFKKLKIYKKLVFSTMAKGKEYDPENLELMKKAICDYHNSHIYKQKKYGDATKKEIIKAGRKDILFK